jgi:hypothetical protein
MIIHISGEDAIRCTPEGAGVSSARVHRGGSFPEFFSLMLDIHLILR